LPQKITLLRSILRSYGGQARSSKTDFDPVYTKVAKIAETEFSTADDALLRSMKKELRRAGG
jgi:hypothetical protein